MTELRVLVIADDLTGAAEIAGIGYRHGLSARLFREPPSELASGLTVIDTDSRHETATVAAKRVRDSVARIDLAAASLIFKKTDSALRGNIVAEVEALRALSCRALVTLLPQNPSRGRTISHGQYFLNGVRLHQTEFANDPDHPAKSSDVQELLDPPASVQIADASTPADVCNSAENLSATTLPAGGADFFTALLQCRGLSDVSSSSKTLAPGPRLFVCGSASAYARALPLVAAQRGIACHPLSSGSAWASNVIDSMRTHGRALMFVGGALDNTPGAGRRIQQRIADTVRSVLHEVPRLTLLMGGGATASAVSQAMRWERFEVTDTIGSSELILQPQPHAGELNLIIKPGSYAWPDSVFDG